MSLRRLPGDAWFTLGLLLFLLVITVAAAVQQAGAATPPALTSISNLPDGARALYLWLEKIGLRPSSENGRDGAGGGFSPPPDAAVALMLEPQPGITSGEWQELDDWVEAGGTLVLVGEKLGADLAMEHFDFELRDLADLASPPAVQTPLLASPPLSETRHAGASTFLRPTWPGKDKAFVTHLAVPEGALLVSFEQGEGRVILGSLPYPFTNAGLKQVGNPALVANILAGAVRPGRAWFDEWHHGIRPDVRQVVGPGQWLRGTAAGRSLLYVATVIFIVLLLQGRSFGRAVPLAHEVNRRAPLEYITALANLNRRAGHRQAVLSQYHQWLKRELGRRYRLNPTLPDEEYVAALAKLRTDLDAQALLGLLRRLRKPNPSEGELVQLAREASKWIRTT